MTTIGTLSTFQSAARLLEEADALKYTDHQRVLQLTAQALHLAQESGDYNAFTSGLSQQAWANAMLNRYGDALTGAMEALVLARNHGYKETEAKALHTIAHVFGRCGLRQEANLLFNYQYELAETLQNREIQAAAMNDHGLTLMVSGEVDSALETLQQALVLVPDDTHDGFDRARVLESLSLALVYAGRFSEATPLAEEMLELVNRTQYAPVITNAEISATYVSLASGDLTAANQHLARADAFAESPNHTEENRVKLEMVRGNLLAAMGSAEAAVDTLENAYSLSVGAERIDLSMLALNFVRAIYEKCNNFPGIVATYRRLIDDIAIQQEKDSALRLKVLAMVFAQNKAAIQDEIHLTQQKYALLQRVSHEFRTPLAIIKSTADLVGHQGEEMPLEQRQTHLQGITGQVKGMTAMLENITRLLGQDEAAPETVPAREFSVGTVAFLAVRRLEGESLPAARVRTDIHPDVQAMTLPADAVETILYQLMSNALRFSSDEVLLEARVEAGALVLRVSDQGIGIPQADQSDIFQPLSRGSNAEGACGAGLGLAIVAKLVSQMHGMIDLDSDVGQGTRISVRLPLPQRLLAPPAWRVESPLKAAKARRKTKKTS